MFERFTQGARATVKGAVGHAERVGAGSVTEEHLLLALLEQEGSRASFAVAALGLHGRRWWSGHRPFTPGAKSILEKSLRVALGRGDRFIGEEHLLLALTAAPGVVADVLAEHGATYATVHRALYGPEADGQGHAKAG